MTFSLLQKSIIRQLTVYSTQSWNKLKVANEPCHHPFSFTPCQPHLNQTIIFYMESLHFILKLLRKQVIEALTCLNYYDDIWGIRRNYKSENAKGDC